MRRFGTRLVAVSLVAIVAAASTAARAEPALDPATGFRMTGDWELVRMQCTVCHSSKMVTQQRGTAAQWRTVIRWMQATQNLWKFDPEIEKRILAYLTENYPPSTDRRRASIPPDLMPPNPYAPAVRADKE